MKHFLSLAARYDKTPRTYAAMVAIACMVIRLRLRPAISLSFFIPVHPRSSPANLRWIYLEAGAPEEGSAGDEQ